MSQLDLPAPEASVGVKFIHAYLECSDEIQQLVKQLIDEVLFSKDTDSDEKHMALASIADALFPKPHKGQHGMDLLESELEAAATTPELEAIVNEMNVEEDTFSTRLRNVLEEQGITQQELADMVGLRQSAIANLLGRECRPQKRTVVKIAEALDIPASDLWPSI